MAKRDGEKCSVGFPRSIPPPFLFCLALFSRQAEIPSRFLLSALAGGIFRGRGRRQDDRDITPFGRNLVRQRPVLVWVLNAILPALTNKLCSGGTRGVHLPEGIRARVCAATPITPEPSYRVLQHGERRRSHPAPQDVLGSLPGVRHDAEQQRKIRVRPFRGRHPDQPVEEWRCRLLAQPDSDTGNRGRRRRTAGPGCMWVIRGQP